MIVILSCKPQRSAKWQKTRRDMTLSNCPLSFSLIATTVIVIMKIVVILITNNHTNNNNSTTRLVKIVS